jgi:acetyltransferase-like isoleucine patch superfamily enzyme
MQFLISKINGFRVRLRRLYYYSFFKSKDVIINGKIHIRGGLGNHKIGSGLNIYPNVIIESFSKECSLKIGDNCYVSYGVIIAVNKEVKIGNNVWIGEYSSIRDTTHDFSKNLPLGSKEDITMEIKIGNNVWIGRGSILLPGTVIGNNVVVGANSVVSGILKSNSLYAGSPVRYIKSIEE